MADNPTDYDDLLSHAGNFGRYQVLLFFSTFPFYLYGVFVYYTQPFLTEVGDHWCWIPELENLTDIERLSLAIPPDENLRSSHSQCRSYVANWSEVLANKIKPNETWNTIACEHGWEFNRTELPYHTISSEMYWVCDKKSYPNTALAVFYTGSVFGGLVIGTIADRYGRLPAAVISNIIGCVGGVLGSFSRNFLEFVVCRFLVGMASDSCMMMMYLIVLEYVAPKYRSWTASSSFALFYAPAVTVLPWICLACGHWRIISLVTSVPMCLVLFAPFVIPESPRWLLSTGRIEEAIQKVCLIGKINRKEIPFSLIEKFRTSEIFAKKDDSVSILKILKRPILRKTFIYTSIVYMSCTLVFDALVRSIELLDYDFFIAFTAISFTEFPSFLLTALVMDVLGRRWLTTLVMTVSFIFTILTAVVGGGQPSLVCAIVARFAANMGCGIVIQWSAELIPTPIRGTGSSIVYMLSHIMSITTPYILYLNVVYSWLPLVLIAIVAAVCATVSLLLPETANREMPQTFDDAEQMVKSQEMFYMPCINRKTRGESKSEVTDIDTGFERY